MRHHGSGTGCTCELLESGSARLAVPGEDSEPAHGSAQGVRLGQHQADREVPRQSLSGCPKVCVAENPTQIKTYIDSDWAGNKIRRKSTSGGVMFLGKHLIKSWSSTQQVMALSRGEAELYGMLEGATQTKGLISVMADFDEKVVATVCSDASAAIGMAHRQGLGKTGHVEVRYLWIQHEAKEG